ncbi:MAG: sigma-70 family RNA polymerase sigma factor [Actinomycetales bacterium]|nr:sigma-70 family RNA polymerase sigma factor [Actinomycetales bacterium]
MADAQTALDASDTELIERARSGDSRAFGELWRRHYLPAVRAARQFTSIDADDLVSEAYTRIYQRVLAGGGPTGAFRPYLYTTIRHLAASWGTAESRTIQVEMIEDFQDERIAEDPATEALDRTLTTNAFRSLPERWQTVLWYTEVEGMDPHEVAPIMGLSANGVAALSYRAREGLRKAWLQAHITRKGASGECAWAQARLGEHARDGLSARDRTRMQAHLETCTSCQVVSAEVDEVGSHLAMVLLPLVLGGAAGGGLLAALAAGSGPGSGVEVASAIPAMPDSLQSLVEGATAAGAAGATAAGGLAFGSSMAGTGAAIGGLAVAAALTGGALTAGTFTDPGAGTDSGGGTTVAQGEDRVGDVLPDDDASAADLDAPVDPTAIPDGLSGSGGGLTGTVDGLVDDVVSTITGDEPPAGHDAPGGVVGATASLNLSGTGTPGAHVSLQAAGVVYATTTVGPDGRYSLAVTGLPGGLSSLTLVQDVDESLLGGLLGGVVNALKPLTIGALSTDGSGISVVPVG